MPPIREVDNLQHYNRWEKVLKSNLFQTSCRPKYLALGVRFLYRMNNKVKKSAVKKILDKITITFLFSGSSRNNWRQWGRTTLKMATFMIYDYGHYGQHLRWSPCPVFSFEFLDIRLRSYFMGCYQAVIYNILPYTHGNIANMIYIIIIF